MSEENKQPSNSEGYQIEALHMAHVFGEMVDRHLCNHWFVHENMALKEKANAAVEALGDLYQAIGAADVVKWELKQ